MWGCKLPSFGLLPMGEKNVAIFLVLFRDVSSYLEITKFEQKIAINYKISSVFQDCFEIVYKNYPKKCVVRNR